MSETNCIQAEEVEEAEKIDNEDFVVQRRKKTLFEFNTDATVSFSSGESIKINGHLLALHSSVFMDAFYGESPITVLNITDFDFETFQIFLDILFNLREITVLDALIAYPLAHKYQAEEGLQKCIQKLKPKHMDENVCLTLNLAFFYQCDELVNDVVNFMENKFNILNVLENKNYLYLLEPSAFLKLAGKVTMDSYLWKLVFEWGENYLKKEGKTVDVVAFLQENDLLTNFSVSHFESVKSFLDFHEVVSKKMFLSSDQICDFLKDCLLPRKIRMLPRDSVWVDVKGGEEFTESMFFKQNLTIVKNDSGSSVLNVWLNTVRSKLSIDSNIDSLFKCKVTCRRGFAINEKDAVERGCIIFKPRKNEITGVNFENLELNRFSFVIFKLIKSVFGGNIEEKNPFKLVQIDSVAITYTFLHDCRILKTSLSDKFSAEEKLYFTFNVDKSLEVNQNIFGL